MATLLISSSLPQNMYGEAILTEKGNNKIFCLFKKKAIKSFVCSGYNLFHMRNEKE